MTSIRTVISTLESLAPPNLQESYDNSGLLVGNPDAEVSGVLICLDSTEAIVDEAIAENCNLIIAHHPIIFKGLKRITGSNYVERTVLKAIKNDVAIYAIHTNLDNVKSGVNARISERLGLTNTQILRPTAGLLNKLVVFVPGTHQQEVLEALFSAGAGNIGEYENCAFTGSGEGQFKPTDAANPYQGKAGELEKVAEDRIEVLFESYKWPSIYKAMTEVHPYEEVAYYATPLDNVHQEIGSGMIGELAPMSIEAFLEHLRSTMQTGVIRYTTPDLKEIKKVAVCGGAGSFLIGQALNAGADAFVTADLKYHEFFDAENRMLLADIGHYESEVFTKDLIYEILRKNFTTFAVNLAGTNTNPIRYF